LFTTGTGQSISSPTSSSETESINTNYVGCLRLISIDSNFQNPLDWKDNYFSRETILFDSCQMLDRCSPNPCEHGGKCNQNSLEFTCDCEETGYTGATCHMPLYPLSCNAYTFNTFQSQVTIDIDGSGPLEPFPVTCQFYHDGLVETIIHHLNEDTTLVDGYDLPGSFSQDINYQANLKQIEALLNRSDTCKQYIKLQCKNNKLFNSPG